MRHDQKGMPKELKSVNNREQNSVLFVYHEEKNAMLVSYSDYQRKKIHVHVMYNHLKGGGDIVDLLSTNHLTRIKSRR